MVVAQSAASQVRAKQYSTIKYALLLSDMVFLLVLLFVFAWSGYSRLLARWVAHAVPFSWLSVPVYTTIVGAAYYLLSLPTHFYLSFTLEHRFSLSRQTLGSWLKDELKGVAVSCVLSLALIMAFYGILAGCGPYWWLVAGAFWIFFTLVLAKLVPVCIVPLFYKYKKLSDETLRARIIHLAQRMEIKLLDCFEIDFSRKTSKANAAFTGWGNTRRVILADTLKDTYSHDEIELILAHEFAHYKLAHLMKLVVINAASTLALLYLMHKTGSGALACFAGLRSLSDVAAFPVLGMYLVIFGMIMQPLGNWISRVFERQADAMAILVTGNKEAFISMMEKLSAQNLSDRNPHPLIKWFFFDHPPTDERIALAKQPQEEA